MWLTILVLPRSIKYVILAIPLWMASTLKCGIEQRSARLAHNQKVGSSNLSPATTVIGSNAKW